MNKRCLAVLIIIALIIAGCLSPEGQTLTAVARTGTARPTITPSFTPTATNTSTWTPTPSATATRTPRPTRTKKPTETPVPTYTLPPETRPEYDSISGVYSWGDSDQGRWCSLAVILRDPTPPQKIAYDLYCNQGAPTWNSGYYIGELIIENNRSEVEMYEDCTLTFEFNTYSIIITEVGRIFNCAFQRGVVAGGTYILVDPTPPEIGCLYSDLCVNINSDE